MRNPLRGPLVNVCMLIAGLALACPAATQADAAVVLSFGRVMPDEAVEEVITFANPTDRILEIDEIQVTPPLVAQEISSIILPGMEGSFKLVLGEKREFGLYEGAVRLSFKNDAHPAVTFAIEGFVIPPIEFQPMPAFFVSTNYGKTRSAAIEILNHRAAPLFLTSAESNSKRYTVKLETVEKGKHYRLTLTLDGKAMPGEERDEIILHADPELDEPLKIQANTKIKERVYHFPDAIDMGALPLHVARNAEMVQTLRQTLMAYRPDTDDFEVEASIDLDYIKLVSERGPDGDRYQMDLTLIPEKVKPGKIEGTVSIKTNDKEFPVLNVPVSGYILD